MSIPAARSYTRREIDELTEFVKHYGAKGLVWIGVTGAPDAAGHYRRRAAQQVAKFLTPDEMCTIVAPAAPRSAT